VKQRAAVGEARRAARIRRIVEDVMARRDAGQAAPQAEVIAAHPGLSPELERELSLLALLERARSPASTAGDPSGAFAPQQWRIEPLAEDAFEGYTLLGELHRGGQGIVYEAVQKSTARHVAVKLMRDSPMNGEADIARFEREVRILGQLEHPGIVGILATGVRAGRFYYVMELIQGVQLDEYAAALDRRERPLLQLFERLCDAVNAAHLRGIIHRDLKPGNILVDVEGHPHILDFGLARIAPEWSASRQMTTTGQFVGSMPWASPEQVAGDQSKVDLRTDVYSVGVMLYQALTGAFPYNVEGTPLEVLNNIMTSAPSRPRCSSAGGHRISADVEAIVLKCLSKERKRRYHSAGELGADLARCLAGRPVLARPPSAIYLISSLARRHRAIVAGGALAIAALLVGLVGLSLGLVEAAAGRRAAERSRDEAVAAEALAAGRLTESQRLAYVGGIAAADSALRANDASTALMRLAAVPAELRGWEWRYLSARADASTSAIDGPDAFDAMASPDSDSIAIVRLDGVVELLDARSLRKRWAARMPLAELPARAGVGAFSSDGRMLATFYDHQLFIWSMDDGALLFHAGFENTTWGIMRVAFSADCTRIAANGVQEQMRIWTLEDRQLVYETPTEMRSSGLDYTPDGRLLIVDTREGLLLLDAVTNERIELIPLPREPKSESGVLQVSPDGREVAVARESELLTVGLDGSRRVRQRGSGHSQRIIRINYGPWVGGQHRLVTCSWDRTLRIWETTKDGEPLALLRTLVGHTGETWNASLLEPREPGANRQVHADEGRVLSASSDGSVRLWPLAPLPGERPVELGSRINRLAFSTEADAPRSIAAMTPLEGSDNPVCIVDAATARIAAKLPLPALLVPLTVSPRFDMVAFRNAESELSLWDVGRGVAPVPAASGRLAPAGAAHDLHERWTVPLVADTRPLFMWAAFSPDARLLAATDSLGVLCIWRTSDGKLVSGPLVLDRRNAEPVFSARGDLLYLPLKGRGIVVLRLPEALHAAEEPVTLAQERLIDTLPGSSPDAGALCIACSHDGSRLATGHTGGTVTIWDARAGRALRRLGGMNPAVWCAAFSPDGSRLATGSQDRLVRIWDVETGEELLVLHGHRGTVSSLSWSADGEVLASGSLDGTMRLWSATAVSAR
jgi:eukaryotic-like serine/threonine-protein kinase